MNGTKVFCDDDTCKHQYQGMCNKGEISIMKTQIANSCIAYFNKWWNVSVTK